MSKEYQGEKSKGHRPISVLAPAKGIVQYMPLSLEQQYTILDFFTKVSNRKVDEDNFRHELYPVLSILHVQGYKVGMLLEECAIYREDMLSNMSQDLAQVQIMNQRMQNLYDGRQPNLLFKPLYDLAMHVYNREGAASRKITDDCMMDTYDLIREASIRVMLKEQERSRRKKDKAKKDNDKTANKKNDTTTKKNDKDKGAEKDESKKDNNGKEGKKSPDSLEHRVGKLVGSINMNAPTGSNHNV